MNGHSNKNLAARLILSILIAYSFIKVIEAAPLLMEYSRKRVPGNLKVDGTVTAGSFSGDGSGLTGLSGSSLGPGSTNYIQNSNTLQAGSTFYVSSGSINGQALFAVNSGSVGIRTSSPDVPLHVLQSGTASTVFGADTVAAFQGSGSDSTNARISVMSGTNGAAILQLGDTDAESRGRIQYSNNTDQMEFHTNNSERVFINVSGNVGIGPSLSQSSLLDVNGGSITVRGANAGLNIQGGGVLASSATFTLSLILPQVAFPTSTAAAQQGILVYDTSNRRLCLSTGTVTGDWKCGGFDGL